MNNSSFVYNSNAGVVPFGVKQNKSDSDNPKGTGKVEALEAILRTATINQKEQQAVKQAPPDHRKQALRNSLRYPTDDTQTYKQASNALGDYSNLTKQMQGVSQSAERALELTTLESKKNLSKIQSTNDSMLFLANQIGLESASSRQFKRRVKFNRMSGQTML
jgi:hypothetical protein